MCVVALVQIPFIKRRADNMHYFGNTINKLIAIQLSLAIVAASLPDLRALIARSFPNFSPLHHRSLNTHARDGEGIREDMQDVEAQGQAGGSEQKSANDRALENRKSFKKPDWMRDTLPASLMDTRVTITRARTGESIPQLLEPQRSRVEELPTPGNSAG